MPVYRVTQTIEVNSYDAIEAVKEARLIQLDGNDHDREFTVRNVKSGKRSEKIINLYYELTNGEMLQFDNECSKLRSKETIELLGDLITMLEEQE